MKHIILICICTYHMNSINNIQIYCFVLWGQLIYCLSFRLCSSRVQAVTIRNMCVEEPKKFPKIIIELTRKCGIVCLVYYNNESFRSNVYNVHILKECVWNTCSNGKKIFRVMIIMIMVIYQSIFRICRFHVWAYNNNIDITSLPIPIHIPLSNIILYIYV